MHHVLEAHARIALATKQRLDETNNQVQLSSVQALVDGICYVYGMAVAGDIAEFGTMAAYTSVALAYAVDAKNREYRGDVRGTKKLWYFDSFEGLPEITNDIDRDSHHVATGLWSPGLCKFLDEQTFKSIISNYISLDEVNVVKGWYKDTIHLTDPAQRFALLNIDCDLYESTMDVLNTLFSRRQISRGALILFDDWDCNAADPNLGERRAWSECVARYNIKYSDHGAYGYAGHKFIVHSHE